MRITYIFAALGQKAITSINILSKPAAIYAKMPNATILL